MVPLSFILIPGMIYAQTKFSPLENTRIQKFDELKVGHSTVGIDGALIHDMLWVIDMINSIQHGTQQHNTLRSTKKYSFEGCHCTLEQLADKESDTKYLYKKTDIHDTLNMVKQDFNETVTHFMQQLIVKTVICDAIDEWCEKSNRNNSLLKIWATTNKEEFDVVYHSITSAASLNLFLTDLKDFLTDVIHSCPRAWNDFLEHKEEYATLKH